MMVSASRIQAREGSTSIRRVGVNARLREQTITAKRAQTRGQILGKAGTVGSRIGLFALVVGVLVGGFWYGWKSFSESRFASLRDIEVRGFQRLTPADVAGLTGLKGGRALSDLDLDAVRRRLESDPWIADAKVSRRWPRKVQVSLTERVAVARVSNGDWVSEDGVVLPRRGFDALPLLVGQGYKGGRIPVKRAVQSLSTLRRMQLSGAAAGLEQVSLSADGSMEWRFAGLGPTVLVGADDWKRSLARVAALRQELGEEIGLFSSMDLRHGTCASLKRADGGV